MLYADTSALAKLVLEEPEAPSLRSYLAAVGPVTTSAITATELVRAVRRVDPGLEAAANTVIDALTLADLDIGILTVAGTLAPPQMRTLDAIHVATALALGGELDAVVTYDARMAAAARSAGLRVEAPA